jgi:DNA gyrase subunit A
MKIVSPSHELMLISEEGVVIRVKADDISKLGRSTQGVKVMNVSEADRVCAIARVAAGKKKTKPRGVAEGQTELLEGEAEALQAGAQPDERDLEAEELVAEEFEDAEDGELAEE